ncbi:MAG: AmmeMemoRadiSam system protein B, partial [Deltaproteobacteria bacterium]
GERLFWILGVDLAHVGRRYGDQEPARAHEGPLGEVERRDLERLDRICQGDAEGLWALTGARGDDLRWCGLSPFHAFLRAGPAARGRRLRYGQWNIDDESVVSFGALAFERR